MGQPIRYAQDNSMMADNSMMRRTVDTGLAVFLVGGALTLCVALFTVALASQALRSALSNPVEALRHE